MAVMSDVAARHDRFQLSLAAIVALLTLLATAVMIALTPRDFWAMAALFVYFPFAVGLVVGRRSKSRAQLLTAPPVAAAIVPLAILLVLPVLLYEAGRIPRPDLFLFWVMMFPVLLVMGAPAALAGSVVGYWFRGPRQPAAVRS